MQKLYLKISECHLLLFLKTTLADHIDDCDRLELFQGCSKRSYLFIIRHVQHVKSDSLPYSGKYWQVLNLAL